MDQSVGLGHLVAIGIAIGSIIVLVPLARKWPGKWVTLVTWTLALALVANEVGWQLAWWRGGFGLGPWSLTQTLPLYVCDVAAFICAAALVTRQRILAEIAWYWAMAGTVQGILTPDHAIGFPTYDWLEYYFDHVGVVFAACWLVFALGLHPRSRAVFRVIAVSVAFVASVGLFDAVTGADYDYLHDSHPPGLLSLLGPWPWYLVGGVAVGLVSFLLFDLPFWPERHRRYTSRR